MDGQQISLTGSSFPLRPSNDQAFQSHSPGLADDEILGPALGYPFPNFQVSSSFPAGFAVANWEQGQSVQRYLNDDQMMRTLFHAEASSTTPPRRLLRRAVGPTVAAPPHPGFASPLSSIDPWAGTNSALSPAADTESCYDNYPATPPDTTAITPYSHPTQLEWARDASPLHLFNNMGPASNPTCNPGDIDPSQHLGYGEPDGSDASFDLTTQTSFPFETYPPQCEVEPPQERTTAAQSSSMSILEDMSPTVEDEIKAVRYPLAPAQSSVEDEDECDASDEVADAPPMKRTAVDADDVVDDDDDDDYIPGKKPRANAGATPRRTRPKQASSSRAPKFPAKKKTTTASSGPQSEMYAVPSGTVKALFRCDKCDQGAFKDMHSLQSHIKRQHNQPFKCVFHFAGCTAIFPNKNEWKRHVDTQHLLHKYYVCREGACGKSTSTDKIFRRKDLFTQHLRRMHRPAALGKPSKHPHRKGGGGGGGAASAEAQRRWEDYVAARQADCERIRCVLPRRTRCPVESCADEFHGVEAWDMRMEHVAKHLEKAALGEEPPVEFGGENDTTLIAWATKRGVNVVRRGDGDGRWVLNDPVEGGLGQCNSNAVGVEDEKVMGEIVVDPVWDPEADAEGEEYDE